MYAPDQGMFKAELFIKQGPRGYQAFLRARGGEEVMAMLDDPPELPAPGRGSPSEYGFRLFKWVFRDRLRQGLKFIHDLSYRSADEMPSMRLLLQLEPDSPLSELSWETLCVDPSEPPISLTTAFSRYVPEPTPRRPPVWDFPIRILLVVSNPEGLQRFDLASVDQNLEKSVLQRAEVQLTGRILVKRLLRPTLEAIQNEERMGYHITHLLAHATPDRELGGVLLADDHGKAVAVDVADLANAITLPSDAWAPYLVFLALPMNSEAPHGRVLMELASRLIRGGVQSVVVVKAPVGQRPLALFVQRFYEVLIDTGVIDVAMTEARKRLYHEQRDSWDWAWPVLFTRASDSSIQQRLPPSLEASLAMIQFGG
jgi:hypothetical protein